MLELWTAAEVLLATVVLEVWAVVAVVLDLTGAVEVVLEPCAGAVLVVDEDPPQAVITSAAAIATAVQKLRVRI